jgi:hypothetical protein
MKKAMTTMLSLPSSLRWNAFATTNKKEDSSFAAIAFFAMLQQKKKKTVALLPLPSSLRYKKKEKDGSFTVVAFFATLQQKKKKKVMVTLLSSPSSLHWNKTKRRRWQERCRRLLRCSKRFVAIAFCVVAKGLLPSPFAL